MASAIAKVYARSCEKGTKNFKEVPDNLQKEVKAIIEADGYVINKDGTVTPAPAEAEAEAEEE